MHIKNFLWITVADHYHDKQWHLLIQQCICNPSIEGKAINNYNYDFTLKYIRSCFLLSALRLRCRDLESSMQLLQLDDHGGVEC